jgi:putative ABC transport system permease protein
MPFWLIRVRTFFRRARMERELDAELAFHLEMAAAEYVRRGMSPERARREARQIFGGVEHVKDDVRDTWLVRVGEALAQDVRDGVRGLAKNRGYAAAVILTMALGVGATSAIFSVVNAVVLRPLPYGRGSDLLLLRQARDGVDNTGFSLLDLDAIKAASATLDAVVEYHNMYFILLGGEEPARVAAGVVSWDYFDTLGITPVLGRTFRDADDRHGASPTLLLSFDYWQRAFGGDPTIVGRVLQMNDHPHTVIGVLPDVPLFPQPNDIYMPRSACPFRMNQDDASRRGSGMASAIGRLVPGATLADLRADLEQVTRTLRTADPAAYPAATGHRFEATPLRREFTRNFDSTLAVLLGTAAFVLLIVCASVTNLSVARTMRREQELTLRAALGAGRARLLRQLLTESVIVSVAGGLAGLIVAAVASELLVSYVSRYTLRATEIRIDRTVLSFTVGVSLVIGIVSGMLPALGVLTRHGGPGRRHTHGTRIVPGHAGIRRALIVAQVAASFMLLIGAGLTIRSLMKLTGVDPGFSTDHVLAMQLDMNFSKYTTDAQRAAFLDRVAMRLQQVPGVTAAGAVGALPFMQRTGIPGSFRLAEPPANTEPVQRATIRLASEDYFRAIGVSLREGRSFARTDDLDHDNVVIVNEALARRYWPTGAAVGQRLGDLNTEWFTIVGVVANFRQQLSVQPVDEIYVPMRQMPYVSTDWVLRATTSLDVLAPMVRDAIYDLDPDQPVHRLQPLTEIRSASLAPPRLTATLLGLFAALALVITAAGIAGVIAFSVNQRTQEFGVRVALGARRTDVVSMVVGEGVRLAAKGLAIGAAGALLLGGVLSTMLFGIGPTDSVTYAFVSLVLLLVAALACLIPALRAASVDPMRALRH